MNKKALLGLSAILFVGTITFICSNLVGHNPGGSVQRADAPLPPIPWPWALSVPSDGRVS